MNVAGLQLSTSSKRDSKDVSKFLKIAFFVEKKRGRLLDTLEYGNLP